GRQPACCHRFVDQLVQRRFLGRLKLLRRDTQFLGQQLFVALPRLSLRSRRRCRRVIRARCPAAAENTKSDHTNGNNNRRHRQSPLHHLHPDSSSTTQDSLPACFQR